MANKQVFRLDVSVNDVLRMAVRQCFRHLANVAGGPVLAESPLRRQLLVQLPLWRKPTASKKQQEEKIRISIASGPSTAQSSSRATLALDADLLEDQVDSLIVPEVAEHAQDVFVAQVGLDFNFSPKLVLHSSLQKLALLQNLSHSHRLYQMLQRVQGDASAHTFSATMNFVRRSLAR